MVAEMKLATEAERTRWLAFVAAQPLPLEVDCKAWKKSRSSQQNRLLFGIVYPPIAEHTGYEVGGDGKGNGIHEWMCGTYFGWVDKKVPKTPNNLSGIESVPFRTTTRNEHGKRNVLKADAFSKFLDHVDRMAAKAGIFVPLDHVA